MKQKKQKQVVVVVCCSQLWQVVHMQFIWIHVWLASPMHKPHTWAQ